MIVYLRVVPGLWVAVEERDHPGIHSYPVVIGGLPHQRGTVREANFSAQRCGVRTDMPLSEAYRRCPDAIFLVPDLPRYEASWDTICTILQSYTPLVERVTMGQAVCDLSGCEQLWGDEQNILREIARQIRQQVGIVPWLGAASNRLVAQIASMEVGAGGITLVEPGQERRFLADLPITLLPDLDEHLSFTFQVLGLQTIGQLATLPLAAVEQRFGSLGRQLHRYACGVDPRPVVPPSEKPVVAVRYECEDGSPEEVMAAIHQLAESCAAELQQRHLAGRLVSLTLTPRPPLSRAEEGKEREETLVRTEMLGGGKGRPRGAPLPVGTEVLVGEKDDRKGRVPQWSTERLAKQRGGEPPRGRAQTAPTSEGKKDGGRGECRWPTVIKRRGAVGVNRLHPSGRNNVPGSIGEQGEGSEVVHERLLGERVGKRGNTDKCHSPLRVGRSQPLPLPPVPIYRDPTEIPSSLTTSRGDPGGRPLPSSNTSLSANPSPPGPLSRKGRGRILQGEGSKHKTLVRTPVGSAFPLIEQAERLLRQGWLQTGEPLQRIELEVSEFEPPAQLSFDDFNQLAQTGRLAGLSENRLAAIVRQEQVLNARYGKQLFRHVAQLDPKNILTERRFRWGVGLAQKSPRKRRQAARRRR